MNNKTHTDIKQNSGLVNRLPAAWRPYALLARLDRPVGVWLLVLPAWWAIILTAEQAVDAARMMALFGLGALIMRSAGCVVNDIWDRDFDRQVARTRMRPLAAGMLSVRQALVFLFILLCAGFLILIQLNVVTVFLGFGVVPLIAAYPFMKRVTWWPQAFLGLVFSFSALMGWSAMTGSISMPALLLALSCALWTFGYDTIYGHQDKDDDRMIGVKSSSLKLGPHGRVFVLASYVLSWLCLAFAVGSHAVVTQALFLTPGLAHFCWQILYWQPDDPVKTLTVFKSNRDYGLLVVVALIAGRFL